MKLVIFGLTVSSSWGNGHATLWRARIRALARRGWEIVFYERDVLYYARARDLTQLPGGRLVLYQDWCDIKRDAALDVRDADVAMVTSYCPDGIEASRLVCTAPSVLKLFYDLDAPVTLSHLQQGEPVPYIGPRGFADFDLVLSYAGGAALDAVKTVLGARRVAPLYGHVDPEVHRPGMPNPAFAGDLSYLGTYAQDRQQGVDRFLVAPALREPDRRFVLAGAQYPNDFPWTGNIHFVRHLPPADHPSFYASSRLTLNVTRQAMAALGWCPSGRLFAAAACGAAIVTDCWPGIETFFELGREVIPVETTDDVVEALALADDELAEIGRRARERVLAEHTSDRRAEEFEAALRTIGSPSPALVSEGA